MRARDSLSPLTIEAARMLGQSIDIARRERRWTLKELAERVGVSDVTIRKVVRGDPSVSLGVAFETAVVCGVPLFDPDPHLRSLERESAEARLLSLPKRIRPREEIRDDF